MPKPLSVTLAGHVTGGQIDVYRVALNTAVRSWPDGDVIVTIEADEPKRSLAANRYLFGVVYRDIEEFTGQSKDDIHDEMCARFTSKTIHYTNPATGEIVEMEVVTRTSGMKVLEFHRFVEQVKLFAGEFFGLTFEDAGEDVRREHDRALAREAKLTDPRRI